jgi:hypothetical protein
MKKRHAIITALAIGTVYVVSTFTMPASAEAPQVQWIDDVPVNPALEIEQGLGFAFDSPEGRVVMVLLSGDVSAAEMQAYYDQALKPLDWDKTGVMQWLREGETLQINETTAAGVKLWRIMLRPE